MFGFISKKEQKRQLKAYSEQVTGEVKALLRQVGKFDFGYNTIVWNGGDDNKRITDGYQANHLVYSILNKILPYILRPDWAVYVVKDEKQHKDFQRYKKSIKFFEGKEFREFIERKEAAFERVQNDTWDKLFLYPNDSQMWDELTADEFIFRAITGNALTGSILADGGLNNGKPLQLFTVPANLTTLYTDGKFPSTAVKYVLQKGEQIEYGSDRVVHFRYASMDYTTNGSELWGQSPLQAAANLLTESNESSKANVSAFQNRGAKKAVFIDEPNISYDERVAAKDKMKETWNNEWQNKDNYNAAQFSSVKLGGIDVGLSPVDLDIIRAKEYHRNDMCAVWDFPPPLLSPDAATYNNYKTAVKALLQGPVLSFLIAKREAYNRKNQVYWKGDKREFIDFDVSCFTELAEEATESMKRLNMRPAMLREYYENSKDPVPEGVTEEQLNMWVIPNSLTLTDDPASIGAGLDLSIGNA